MSAITYEIIVDTIGQILTERGDKPNQVSPETPILETGLDSLDVATLVVRLEQKSGCDPFEDPALREYPQTLRQWTSLYAKTDA
jgi:acyl carrier protein